jgi:hypothetical protein
MSVALLVVLSLGLGAPLFANASDAEAGTPVCCRAGGKHHCMLRSSGQERQMAAVGERCPSFPRSMAASVNHHHAAPATATFYSAIASHPACSAQVEAQLRISFDRARQKRGPPQVS